MGSSAGVVTLLFTDLVASTELLARLGDGPGGWVPARTARSGRRGCLPPASVPGSSRCHVFPAVLSRQRNVVEHQVRQTPSGADVPVVAVGRLERIASSGKLKRFIPLGAKG